jgi:TPR repeat protein
MTTKTIAENLLAEMAEAGDATARCELGSRLSSDVGAGQDRDDSRASELYQLAADGGSVNAQHNYGCHLQKQERHREALEYFQKASDAGLPAATHALAQLWWTGFYNEDGKFIRDIEKSKECYERAAEAGFLPAVKFVETARCAG